MVDFTRSKVKSIINQIRAAFACLDKNNDGEVDADELKSMLKKMSINISDQIIHQLITETSEKQSKGITEKEFFRWMLYMDAHHDDLEGELLAAFRVFDTDNSGTITLQELKEGMDLIGEKISEEELSKWLEAADIDKDGSINYEEFIKILVE